MFYENKKQETTEIARAICHTFVIEWASDPAMVYGLAIEKETSDGERFLTGQPTELIRAKKFHQVPTVLGITGKEFQPRADAIIKNDTLRYELNHDFERIGPIAFYYEKDSEKSKMISSQIRKFYLKNREITKDSEEVGMSLKLKEASKRRNMFYQNKKQETTEIGVAHMDDLNYMFFLSKYFPKMFKPSEPESEAVDAYTSILANMAKTGDPTPITKSDFKWQPMTTQNLMYMDIDKINNSLVVSMKHGLPYSERMEFWEAIYPTFITEDANKTIQESV
ncbi:hypothetical protein AAG570_010509 [Ranatra chinensis]|uniref:Carboxylesterase type B domain-containing protein n=1 Tax=Ranatra chinensis TaxID=642074 RepID=A0ABD0YMV4_9HEMI